ncbi:MAG: bacillithiol biosynthesis deacetylase BshB1 [Planctomycetota bacterium]|jgi:bacillithiol biosynthesis deacetylase BshB1
MALDVLVLAAHPDDAEISLGGTILKLLSQGKTVGVCDVTKGEMGTRGSQEERAEEARLATQTLGLTARFNLGLPDGRVQSTLEARESLARLLREQRPTLLIAHHTVDHHPDHAATGRLAQEAWYLSGLKRLAELDGGPEAKRPRRLLHFASHLTFEPTFVVPIDDVWDRKVEVIRCYSSQLTAQEPGDDGSHFLFGADILSRAETKARYWGEMVGSRYGEPLLHRGPISLSDPLGF